MKKISWNKVTRNVKVFTVLSFALIALCSCGERGLNHVCKCTSAQIVNGKTEATSTTEIETAANCSSINSKTSSQGYGRTVDIIITCAKK